MKSVRKRFSIREDKKHRIEVHVAGFCFRDCAGRLQLLAGRRSKDREIFPDRWECGGGQVYAGENFEQALKRHYIEEFGIAVQIVQPLLAYEILMPDSPKIPGIKFLCTSVDNGKENIVLDERELSDAKWVTLSQCKSLRMIPGVPEQAKVAFALARQIFAPRSKKRQSEIGFHAQPKTMS